MVRGSRAINDYLPVSVDTSESGSGEGRGGVEEDLAQMHADSRFRGLD